MFTTPVTSTPVANRTECTSKTSIGNVELARCLSDHGAILKSLQCHSCNKDCRKDTSEGRIRQEKEVRRLAHGEEYSLGRMGFVFNRRFGSVFRFKLLYLDDFLLELGGNLRKGAFHFPPCGLSPLTPIPYEVVREKKQYSKQTDLLRITRIRSSCFVIVLCFVMIRFMFI